MHQGLPNLLRILKTFKNSNDAIFMKILSLIMNTHSLEPMRVSPYTIIIVGGYLNVLKKVF